MAGRPLVEAAVAVGNLVSLPPGSVEEERPDRVAFREGGHSRKGRSAVFSVLFAWRPPPGGWSGTARRGGWEHPARRREERGPAGVPSTRRARGDGEGDWLPAVRGGGRPAPSSPDCLECPALVGCRSCALELDVYYPGNWYNAAR